MSSNIQHTMSTRIHDDDDSTEVNQPVEKKQKCYHEWHVDPTEIRDRANVPFDAGGFGKVYKGRYRGKDVAIKELFCRFGRNEMAEFRREIDIWHKLEHPHILPLLGACDTCDTADAKPFIVSPFMLNGNLNKYLATKPSDAEKLRIMSEVASGMAYLHDNNIVHGDISCRNVLFDENFHVVISDFGLARTKQSSSNSNYATHGQKPGGSLQYMAPEMLDWNNPLGSSKKTDVYAFGILFYEVMINGGAVWVTTDGQPLLKNLMVSKVINGNRPERRRPDLNVEISDDNVWSLIQKCWHQEPRERPSFEQVVSRFYHDLKEYTSREVKNKQRRHRVWCIDPTEIKDRASLPFGWGGFGLVYKATYHNRTVAVKVLFRRLKEDSEIDAFRREIDIWHKLKHPHILPLLGACDASDTPDAKPFMVSPLMPNGTLKDYISKKKPSDTEKLRIMLEVASGMAYLHENNIIHGDISSRNVLLDEKFSAVISDFGLARTKYASSSDNEEPRGTLQYMAPEMLDWENPLGSSKKTDVYAYGILFYEVMINGGAVWVTADGEPLLNNLMVSKVTNGHRPERRRPDLNEEISDDNVWSLIQKCWSQAPSDRPSFEQIFAGV